MQKKKVISITSKVINNNFLDIFFRKKDALKRVHIKVLNTNVNGYDV